MNTKITKNKNASTDSSLKKRIYRLETMLQQLLQLSVNGALADNSLIKADNSKQNEMLSSLILRPASDSSDDNTLQSTIFSIKNSINNNMSDKNNLALSRGQVIAELALAITRFSQRNS